MDEFDFLEEVDVLAKLPADFETNVAAAKWTDRRDALQALLDLLTAHKKLSTKANYGEIVAQLKKVLEKDANVMVAALAAKCLKCIAEGLRKKFSPHAPTILPTIFEKFKEKKPTLRDPLVECIDAVAATISLESMQDDVLAALEKPNPSIKVQTDLFLYRTFLKLNAQTMPKKTLKAIAPLLVKHSMESDPEVRDACYAALGSAMRVIGEKPMNSLIADIVEDKLKMTKIKEYCQKAIDEAGPEASTQPAVPEPKPATPAKQDKPPAKTGSRSSSRAPSPSAENKAAEKESAEERKPPAAKASTQQAAARDEEPAAQPQKEMLLMVNEEKATRLKEEKNFKILKWNFVTPTDEHISQLQAALSANAKGALISQLFNKDFKMQLKGVEEVIKAGEEFPESVAKNSDLLLKWATLRFLETNPTVLIKVLEMSKLVIQRMQDTNESMSGEEINAFLPYLLQKLGEPKDAMRQAARFEFFYGNY
ncbi:hypothetical protein WR25_01466 isoform A [Diploscapter pachys]|uniref:TOG domain-containing protein n=1 Tax=Diploscapter pachys TaxID=2018661 RepID=A0A2A2LGW8_9BILA|nr:hypothetical protein WR25_01466 isoform A [Diploscapter pachys]